MLNISFLSFLGLLAGPGEVSDRSHSQTGSSAPQHRPHGSRSGAPCWVQLLALESWEGVCQLAMRVSRVRWQAVPRTLFCNEIGKGEKLELLGRATSVFIPSANTVEDMCTKNRAEHGGSDSE